MCHWNLVECNLNTKPVTSSLNTSLSSHLTTLSLLSLQRNIAGLNFQLIAPGRTLLKRDTLFQVERGESAREREFLLFSDCLLWIATEVSEKEWNVGSRHWWHSSHINDKEKKRHSTQHPSRSRERREHNNKLQRPGMAPRTRSKSEAEMTEMKAREATALVQASIAEPDPLEPPPPLASFAAATPGSVYSSSQVETPMSPDSRASTPLPSPSAKSYPFPAASPSNRPSPSRAKRQSFVSSASPVPRSPRKKLSRQSSGGQGGSAGTEDKEKWVFKGRVMLMDLDVVVLRPVSYHSDGGSDTSSQEGVDDEENGDDRKFEVHSPSGSFVVYANSPKERDEWVDEIRAAKENYMGSINAARGTGRSSGTVGSGTSTTVVRKKMMALPYKEGDERIGTLTRAPSLPVAVGEEKKIEQRTKVDHFVPPIWIPDSKTGECMRCGRGFGWRRRRHHCRLCGRCICGSCSERVSQLLRLSL